MQSFNGISNISVLICDNLFQMHAIPINLQFNACEVGESSCEVNVEYQQLFATQTGLDPTFNSVPVRIRILRLNQAKWKIG